MVVIDLNSHFEISVFVNFVVFASNVAQFSQSILIVGKNFNQLALTVYFRKVGI
jgi:hypothetical protein